MKALAGTTNRSEQFYVVGDAGNATPGEPVIGLLFSDITSASYVRNGSASVEVTLKTLASASTAHDDGGFIEVDATKNPGLYRFDNEDAAYITGVQQVEVQLVIAGAKNAVSAPVNVEIDDSVVQTGDSFARIGVNGAGLTTRMAEASIGTTGGAVNVVTTLTNKTGFSLAATGLDLIVSTATGVVEIAKAVWDRVLTGATHNIAGSAGRRLRQLTGQVYTDGKAQAGGVNTITLAAGESATDEIFDQSYIAIVDGTGAGQGHHCIAYDGSTKVAIMDDNWVVVPDNTSDYVIFGAGSHDELSTGLAQAGGNLTITLQSNASSVDDIYKGLIAGIVSGPGGDQARRITAYNGTTKVATVSVAWATNPDATSGYMLFPNSEMTVDEITDKTGFSLSATGLDLIVSTATGYIAIAKAVWDRILNKANHNIGQSAGKITRQQSATTVTDGTAQAGGANSITLAVGENSTDEFYTEQLVFIEDGTGAGQGHHITTYNGTTKVAIIDDNWVIQPDNTSDYIIYNFSVHQWSDAGIVQAATGTTITLNGGAVATDDYYTGMLIYLASGTGFGQARRITGYVGATKVATVATWATNPSTDTGYILLPEISPDNAGIETISTVVDAILAMLDDPRAEPGQGAPPVNADAMTKLDYLYKWVRNKKDNDGSTTNYYADDGATVDHKQTTSEAGGTVTKAEISTGP